MQKPTKISPDFQNLYYWEFDDLETSVNVHFNVEKTINLKMFNFEFDKDSNSFILNFSEELPIIEGVLYGKATECQIITDDEKWPFLIKIIKADTAKWPILIRDRHAKTGNIDPHSAYDVVNYITEDMERSEEFPNIELKEMLQFSVYSGYIPAILNGVRALSDNPNSRETVEMLLTTAADQYQSAEAIVKLGVLLFKEDDTRKRGFYYLVRAFELGFQFTAVFIGLCLSPLSDVSFDEKNPQTALKYFEIAINDPIAAHEAAKLYMAGIGTEKDPERAKALQLRAKLADDTFSDLEDDYEVEPENNEKKADEEASSSLISAGIKASGLVLGASALVYAAFRFIQKKK